MFLRDLKFVKIYHTKIIAKVYKQKFFLDYYLRDLKWMIMKFLAVRSIMISLFLCIGEDTIVHSAKSGMK